MASTKTSSIPHGGHPGTTSVRTIVADTDAVAVSAAPANLVFINITNRHSAVVYCRFYNIAAASVNPASSTPILTLAVQPTATLTLHLLKRFSTAISVRAVTGVAETDTTDPATLPVIDLEIK